jgi:hypothetical protein
MALCPSTVSSGGLLPEDFYFALKSDIAPPQVLSQNANTVSLSGGGGAVNIASTSAVALSTQKLTAVTYDTGLLETNVAGVLNVGLGSAIGSTRVEGAKIVIQRDLADPQIEFVKGLGVERIKYDGTKLLMGPVGIDGEIYDNFGSPGAAGQQLQSSGPGLPFVWGAGSGVGLTAVVAGSNIGVDNTNPIAPVVSVAISSTLDMSGQNIINGNDIQLKGTNPSLDFKNSAGVDKAALDYVELTDKVTLTGTNVVLESTGTGAPRVLCDATAGSLEVRGDAIPVRMRRYSATGTTLVSDIQLAGGGVVSIIGNTVAVEPSSGYLQVTGTGVPPILRLFDGLDGGSMKFDTATGGMEINTETGQITMKPATGIVELKGDTSIPYPATLTFTDTSTTVPTVNMSVSNDGFGFGYPQLGTTAGLLSASSGAVEGIAIGTNGTENVVIGYGLPLKISHAFDSQPRLIADADLIKFGIGTGGGVANVEITTDGDTLVTGDNSVIIRSNLTASMEGGFGGMLPSKVELVSGTATIGANQINLVCGGFASGAVSMGDVFDAQNGSKIIINDASSFISITTATLTLPTIPLAIKPDILYYDSVTKSVSYGANVLPVFVTGPTSATPITLTASDNNKTYVFTTRPSLFQQFNAVGLPLGFSISVRNAVGPGASDIDIRKDGAVVLGVLHPRTGAVNASTVPLEVNGTGLIGYF